MPANYRIKFRFVLYQSTTASMHYFSMVLRFILWASLEFKRSLQVRLKHSWRCVHLKWWHHLRLRVLRSRIVRTLNVWTGLASNMVQKIRVRLRVRLLASECVDSLGAYTSTWQQWSHSLALTIRNIYCKSIQSISLSLLSCDDLHEMKLLAVKSPLPHYFCRKVLVYFLNLDNKQKGKAETPYSFTISFDV